MAGERWRIAGAAGLAMVALAVGCGKHEERAAAPTMKPAPETPIDTKRAEVGGAMWDPAWDKLWRRRCRRRCCRRRLPGMCGRSVRGSMRAEAGLKPTSQVRHTEPAVAVKDQVTGVAVRSAGLLQLTYDDAKRYGCDFNWETDRTLKANDPAKTILQPKNNLECGVKILDQQIIGQHKPLLSRTGYWSTLRPGTVSYRVFVKQMANVPVACGVRAKPVRRDAER